MHPPRTIILVLLALTALCALHRAYADDSDIYAPGMSAAADLGSYRTDFAYSDGNHRADIGRYGLSFVQPVAPEAGFGLQGGYMTAGIDNATLNPLGDGYGPYFGLFFAWHREFGNYWGFDAQGGYTWHDMSYSGANQQADVTWYTGYASAGPVLRLDRWRFSAGGYWQNISGHETDSGTVNGRLDFSAAHSSGAYFGFAYYLDQSGSVGIYAFGGARHGVSLVFKREF
ncbi:MAG: hypothetical protein KGI32_06175 [Gammaproteobacteria bacterium]|nr:hypothetical protein [Gammaproteobacteria bacterium]MDE1887707.1 hypothetical protein [Gammaproteobacteria bacterium]MDE2024108.1 hypothetical protein [Gammaproteobacteria bacterium]MDE2139008.1 hypothetical protein [Gammaproteobacteria bacterium]